ncbi:hypothetical protein BT96DRAFT_157802 [Gymnopus androsaceus JB14]|uniref:Uncharacterized protein n=1 Tax=Gymnopus androsaceus JB14 TaxID=1447944 RepID=A0A6A4HAY5_9AGAR|nr:hypothetical protein BT96DRAFT_157802 [Gymnopus androsaceus JB14]
MVKRKDLALVALIHASPQPNRMLSERGNPLSLLSNQSLCHIRRASQRVYFGRSYLERNRSPSVISTKWKRSSIWSLDTEHDLEWVEERDSKNAEIIEFVWRRRRKSRERALDMPEGTFRSSIGGRNDLKTTSPFPSCNKQPSSPTANHPVD